MRWEHVIAVAAHVIDDGISIHAHVVTAARIDHGAQVFDSAHATRESIGHGLVHPVPGIHFAILGVLVIQNRFAGWIHLDAHVARHADHFALEGDVLVGPAKHLHDGTLLAILVLSALIDGGVVPMEIHSLKIKLSDGIVAVV
jgi:hypothetical protein